MNIEVPTKYPLSQNDRIVFLNYVSTATSRCCRDQRSMATDMLWVSLEGRSKTNSRRQQFHSQLCCQIVRFYCWALYKYEAIWVHPAVIIALYKSNTISEGGCFSVFACRIYEGNDGILYKHSDRPIQLSKSSIIISAGGTAIYDAPWLMRGCDPLTVILVTHS
jgi:hypothetical protein